MMEYSDVVLGSEARLHCWQWSTVNSYKSQSCSQLTNTSSNPADIDLQLVTYLYTCTQKCKFEVDSLKKILAPNFMVPVFPLAYIYGGPLFCIFIWIIPTFPIFCILGCNYGISAVLHAFTVTHLAHADQAYMCIKFRF